MEKNGAWTDLLSEWFDYTETMRSSRIHRLWSGVSMIGGAIGRRLYTRVSGEKKTYPNLYVMLVGPPGAGKSIVNDVRAIWQEVADPTGGKAFKVSPQSMTKASFIDELNKSSVTHLPMHGPPDTRHELLVASEEFSVLLPAWDNAMIATLSGLWNNEEEYKETRRTGSVKEVTVKRPYVNMLAGVQPTYLSEHFTDNNWENGFVRRVVMVYADEPPYIQLFTRDRKAAKIREHIMEHLGRISQMYGTMQFDEEAKTRLIAWDYNKERVPTHSKLKHYVHSRTELVVKLSMISAVSRTCEKLITVEDIDRALDWLLEAEGFMPDVFRAMQGKSDAAVIDGLHYEMYRWMAMNKKKSVPASFMFHYLSSQVPSEKADKILIVAERSNIIARLAGTEEYIPRPKHQHGVE